MTDHNKLAQRIVALGVGRIAGPYFQYENDDWDAEDFCNDGRVVLALMEKCSHIDAYWDDTGWSCDVVGAFHNRKLGSYDGMVQRSSLAVAICEACCEALETDDD